MAFPLPLDGSMTSSSGPSLASFSDSESVSSWASSQHTNASSVATVSAKSRGKASKIARLKLDLEELEISNKIAEARRDAAKHTGPVMPTMYLPFFVPEAKMNAMKSAFPRTTFRCTADTAHDHPWAHAETMIATNSAMRLVPAGHTVVDVFGKPNSADKFVKSQARSNKPKTMIGYQALMTERDYVRALDWGQPVAADGRVRYVLGNGDPANDPVLPITSDGINIASVDVPGEQLTWFCNHTFYYLTDEQIATMLRPKGSRMLAVVLRHSADNGDMFMGEMTYSRERGMVEQVNTYTGERYIHRDVSFLWTSKNKVIHTGVGSYAWTFHMVSRDTWIVRLTGVPSGLDERHVALRRDMGVNAASHQMNVHDQLPSRFHHPAIAALPNTEVYMVGSIPVVRVMGNTKIECRLTNMDFFEYLMAKMVGRPRTTEILSDLFAIARSACDVTGSHVGGRNFRVAARDIADHVVLAFLSGLKREADVMRAVETYANERRQHQNLTTGRALFNVGLEAPQTLGKTVLSTMKHVNYVRKQADTFTAILDSLD